MVAAFEHRGTGREGDSADAGLAKATCFTIFEIDLCLSLPSEYTREAFGIARSCE